MSRLDRPVFDEACLRCSEETPLQLTAADLAPMPSQAEPDPTSAWLVLFGVLAAAAGLASMTAASV